MKKAGMATTLRPPLKSNSVPFTSPDWGRPIVTQTRNKNQNAGIKPADKGEGEVLVAISET